MSIRCASVAKTILCFSMLLSGCSLRSGSVSQALHLDLSKLANARVGTTAQGSTSTYACLGVSVSGFDVADSPGLQCGHPGVVAGPLSTSISAVDVMVPAGPARKVTVFGITDAALCSTFDALSLQAAKSLGSSALFDFFDDASVSVALDYNGALAFPDCNPLPAPTSAPFSFNNTLIHNAEGVAIDATQGYLYVASAMDSSISKFNLSTGSYVGSIGNLQTVPTGGVAGCVGAAVGTPSPGWCTGATFSAGSGDGMFNYPAGITVDANGQFLYVSDSSNHRIVKIDASTGVVKGWIGNISTSPIGGDAGCAGATVGTFTPGWCLGGMSYSGNQNGMMNNPNGIALDTSGNIYVSDSSNSRINKYNSAGGFQGWIGNISTSPTGGAAGCAGAGAGTFTPGWCTGGTSTAGSGDGMLSNPQGLFISSGGAIYVVDTSNSRINRYSSIGAFEGWIGAIAVSPTGGAAGCNGAAAGTFTPGWCTGGSSTSGNHDGELNYPASVAIDSSGYLYVTDKNNNRVNKYNSMGGSQGWMGMVGSMSPTGGAPGCSGAIMNSIIPGWCTGGNTISGSLPGSFTNPYAVAVDSLGHLFVTDYNGLQRFF